MATGNHFWLDCIAGIGVAILCDGHRLQRPVAACLPLVGRNRPPADASQSAATRRCYGPAREQSRSDQARLYVGSAQARVALGHRPHPHPGHAERPDGERRRALRRGVGARALRGPERDPLLLARRRRLRRRVAARHPRRRARPRGRQDDAVRRVPRLDDRPRQRGLHADRDRVRSRDATTARCSSRSQWRRSQVRSSSRTHAPRPKRSACAATSASARAPSASS